MVAAGGLCIARSMGKEIGWGPRIVRTQEKDI